MTKYAEEISETHAASSSNDGTTLRTDGARHSASDHVLAAIAKGKEKIDLGSDAHGYVNRISEAPNHVALSKNIDASEKWEPPIPGTWKMNCDASFIARTGETTIGAVTRDSSGQVALATGQ